MGLILGNETIQKEVRWMGFSVTKTPNQSVGLLQVRSSIGYYDAQGRWQHVSERVDDARQDPFDYIMSLTPNQIAGGTQGGSIPVGELISNLLYGIIGGQVKLTATLLIDLTDAEGQPLSVPLTVRRAGGELVAEGRSGQPLALPLLIGASVTLSPPGRPEVSEKFKLLQGDVALKRTLAAE